jgi:hypothetical protein
LYAYARNDPARFIDPSGTFSIELGLCRGICVDTKLAITKDGISACVGGGAGIGNTVDISRFGELDETRNFFVKGSVGLSAGPISASLETEIDSFECSPTLKPKACISVICLGEFNNAKAENATLDVNGFEEVGDELAALGAPGGKELGKKGVKLTGSVLGFDCQQLKW